MNRLQDRILIVLGPLMVACIIWLVSSTSENNTQTQVMLETQKHHGAIMQEAVDFMKEYTPIIISNKTKLEAIDRNF